MCWAGKGDDKGATLYKAVVEMMVGGKRKVQAVRIM